MKTLIVALSLLLLSVSLQAEELVGAVSFADEPLTVTAGLANNSNCCSSCPIPASPCPSMH